MKSSRKGNINPCDQFELINPHAAGIDIGSRSHYVCVGANKDPQPIRKFDCFTPDLHKLADWLIQCKITTVAMESTGVYWIPVFQILESRGLEVILVNARHVKNVPGKKTDVQDCQWLQQLHTYGLLNGSFRPDADICILRSYVRQRDNLIRSAAAHIQRMQKALTQMNLQLHKVISDITGATGIAIIKAILEGERDPKILSKLRNKQIKNDEKIIADALVGDYREEHLFTLKQEYDLYCFYQVKIADCDKQILGFYQKVSSQVDPVEKPLKKLKSKGRRSHPKFNLRHELYRIIGNDMTSIPGFDVLTIQSILSEVGLDMSKWRTEKHFASWLGFAPGNKISGDKVLNTKTRKVINRASVAFRMAAYATGKSHTALGAYYRRLRNRLGAPKAITATARKLACLFYRLLKFGTEYVEQGMNYYETQYQERVIKNLKDKARSLGFNLIENMTS